MYISRERIQYFLLSGDCMTYTSEDLTSVKTALLKLATGARVISDTIGDKTVRYSEAEISQLISLRDKIKAELQSSEGRRHIIILSTSKGH